MFKATELVSFEFYKYITIQQYKGYTQTSDHCMQQGFAEQIIKIMYCSVKVLTDTISTDC